MSRLIVSRLLVSVPLLAATAILIFLLFQLVGIDPARVILGENANEAALAGLRHRMGLDEPVPVQLVNWFSDALQGDLGASWYTNQPVATTLAARLPVTLSVALGGMVVALLVGVPLGVIAAVRRDTFIDRAFTVVATIFVAMPAFWLALVLVLALALRLDLFPVIGYKPLAKDPLGWAHSLTLPWLAIGLGAAGVLLRHTRSAMIDSLESGYVRALTMRGVSSRRRIRVYALKNALIPVLTVIALQASIVIGGSFVVEVVFALPGIGLLLADAVVRGDLPVIQGTVVVSAIVVVLIFLLLDIAYGLLDPRVRVG